MFGEYFAKQGFDGSIDISELRLKFAEAFREAGEFQIGSTGDSMEALVSLLTLLHNERFNSHTLDNSNTSCRNTCPSHKFFHLSILEELNCECGLKKEIPWNYSSFVHPFYVSSILEKAQEVDSKDLIRIREEDLEDYLEHSSLLSVEGQLPEFMKNQWEGLKEDLCSCLFGRTSKKMMVQNEPEVYLIQLVWNNSMPSALEILQVLASLPYTLSLDRIYLNGTQTKYNLRGMILYGCGHYIYCHRLDEGWLKLDDELAPRTKRTNWNILIKELLRCRLYPVGLFYYKESITLATEMNLLDWLKLEKEVIKAQTEYLQSLEPKPQIFPNFIYQIVPRISQIFSSFTGFARSKPSWHCSCGTRNSELVDVCQNCRSIKPGKTGWMCRLCTFLNEETSTLCAGCQTPFPRREEPKRPKGIPYYQYQPPSDASVWTCPNCCSQNKRTNFCVCCKSYRHSQKRCRNCRGHFRSCLICKND